MTVAHSTARTIGARSGGFVLSILLAMFVAGCAIRKPYVPPATAPVALTEATAPAFNEQAYDPRWWRLFQDPVLEELEGSALAANYDIRAAVARVEQARAIFDDVKLDRKGQIAGTALFDRHSGREGQVTLINGRTQPELDIAAGQTERWRIVNACSSRYVRLSLGGRPFRVIGADGGLRAAAETVTEMLLAPADRVELAVGPFEDEGAEIAIESLPYRRSLMKVPRRMSWGTLRVGRRAPSVVSMPAELATIEPLVPAGPVTATRTVRLGAKMTLHGHDWLINGETHHQDAPVKVGELQVWDIVNETGLDHPFHLHGFFFQVVAVDGVPTVPRAWEDTVNVVAKGRVTIAFRADDRPGPWMYHCHILEHHAAGMMGHFNVVRV